MASSISFRIDGPVDTRITITEQADGTLFFELDVLGSGRMGDLRGFYFDLTDPITGLPILPETLVATGDDITSLGLAPDAVADVGPGTNVQGLTNARYGPFDGGLGFGTPGRARDDIQSTSFVLGTQDGTALTLESFDLADFALRYTSAVGPGRSVWDGRVVTATTTPEPNRAEPSGCRVVGRELEGDRHDPLDVVESAARRSRTLPDRVEEDVGGRREERVPDPPVRELAGEAQVRRAERGDVDGDGCGAGA